MKTSEIRNSIIKKKSFLCVGLDSDIQKIPEFLKSEKDPVFEFNKQIIDATHQYAVAYKPNTAFYEQSGAEGWISLKKTAEYIKTKHPDIFLIADAKRGDIGNTSKMYARSFFQNMPFDAVTVAPYMGHDSVLPFLEFENKHVILLALTSNPGSEDFQMIKRSAGDHLFESVLNISKHWSNKNMLMYVVGATQDDELANIRKIVPEHFLLVPGIGAQGGNLQSVIKHGINTDGGLLINSSRGIIFADTTKNFAKTAGEQAKKLQIEMHEAAGDFF